MDEARADEARKAAEEKLSADDADMDYAAAQAELARAVAQLQAIKNFVVPGGKMMSQKYKRP